MKISRYQSSLYPMEFYLILCCLLAFPVVNMASRSKNKFPRRYKAEMIKYEDGQKYLQMERRINNNLKNAHTKLEDCSYDKAQFLCKDKLRCIDLMDTCNGECNCWDCSDETDQCWIHDEYLCQTCYHLCLPTPDGPQCLCDANNYKSSFVCREINECSRDSPCDQQCVKYEGVERCSCSENYRGKPNTVGHSCISDVSYENVLLYSTNDKIKLFNFTANKIFVVGDNVQCKGLSAAGDHFYYGTAERNTGYVVRTSIITGITDLIIETHSPIIFSIDVDWITGNVYFSTDKSLSVCSPDGQLCALIKPLTVTDSCHISLAPRSGLLFHTLRTIYYWHQDSRIMKSSMDGSDETVLVSNGLRHPMSLTVDESSHRVFWMDCELGEIESIQFNGLNRKIWFSETRMHIFTISKFENNIFWTEEGKNTIGSNFEMNTKFIIDKNTTSVKYLYAYNPLLQRTDIPNPCAEQPCDGLCLLRSSSTKGLDYTCLCDDYTPTSEKHWCNNHSVPVHWQFETDFEYEVRPPQTQSPKWFSIGLMIILGSVSAYLIYRRSVVYRYYDRIRNWNFDEDDEQTNLTEYIEL